MNKACSDITDAFRGLIVLLVSELSHNLDIGESTPHPAMSSSAQKVSELVLLGLGLGFFKRLDDDETVLSCKIELVCLLGGLSHHIRERPINVIAG